MDKDARFAAVSRFGHAFRLEIRLLVWNLVYPLLHLLWLVLLVQMFFQRDDRSAQALLETTVGGLSIGLISLAALFTAGISASRATRTRLFELEGSFPYGSEVIFARWLAGLTAMSLFLLQPVGLAAIQGPFGSLVAGLPRFLGEALLTIGFTLAVTWGLASWIRLGRWSYPLLAAGWLAFALGPTMLVPAVPWMNLLNFMRQGSSFYSELFDRLTFAQLPLWFNLFYAGLLMLILALLSLRIANRRFHRRAYPALGVALLALALTGWSGGRYIQDIQAAQVQMQADAQAMGAAQQAMEASGPEGFSSAPPAVDAYDINIDLADPSLPRFQTWLSIYNPGQASITRLDLQLEHTLKVTEASLPFTHQGSLLRFDLPQPLAPGDALDLEVAYQGHIWRTQVVDLLPTATDFITARGVRLSPAVAWYPRPLGQETPARFHLAVSGYDSGLVFGSNLPFAGTPRAGAVEFQASGVTWVFLVGSPELVTEQVGALTLITTWADLQPARQAAASFANLLPALRRFFPSTPVQGMTLMVLDEEPGLPPGTPPADGQVVVVSSRARLSKIVTYHATSIIFEDLWRMSGGSLDREHMLTTSDLVVSTLGSFLHRYHAQGGDPDRTEASLLAGCPGISELIQCDRLHATLVEVLRQDGEPGLLRVLAQIRDRSAEINALEYDRAADWIREAADVR